MLYWFIASLPLLLPFALEYVRTAIVYQTDARDMRTRMSKLTPEQLDADAPWVRQAYGSLQGFFVKEKPLWPSRGAIWQTYRWGTWPTLWAMVVFLAWPWLTFAALMIFQVSMRRARIRPVHVWRCVIYASDVALWVGLATFGMVIWSIVDRGIAPTNWWRDHYLQRMVPPIVAAALILLTYRLASAYRLYLRFKHAIATAIASQMIVAMLILKLTLDSEFFELF